MLHTRLSPTTGKNCIELWVQDELGERRIATIHNKGAEKVNLAVETDNGGFATKPDGSLKKPAAE